MQSSQFDSHAAAYHQSLDKGLKLSGESADYFAIGRVSWIGRRLPQLVGKPAKILDFGCGIGTATPFLRKQFSNADICGVDVSRESLEIARGANAGDDAVRFVSLEEVPADVRFDLAYCNGVFHHIPPADRTSAAASVFNLLHPGAFFAFCENNPFNPGTRLIMSRVEFDRDAILLSPRRARSLLRAVGFQIVSTDYLFVFPAALKQLRGIEPRLCKLPLGGQYIVIARKPA